MMEHQRVVITVFDPDASGGAGATFTDHVQFLGEPADYDSQGSTEYTLYACPGEYRVRVEDRPAGRVELLPFSGGPLPLGERVYGVYTQAGLAEVHPQFADAVAGFRNLDAEQEVPA